MRVSCIISAYINSCCRIRTS